MPTICLIPEKILTANALLLKLYRVTIVQKPQEKETPSFHFSELLFVYFVYLFIILHMHHAPKMRNFNILSRYVKFNTKLGRKYFLIRVKLPTRQQ